MAAGWKMWQRLESFLFRHSIVCVWKLFQLNCDQIISNGILSYLWLMCVVCPVIYHFLHTIHVRPTHLLSSAESNHFTLILNRALYCCVIRFKLSFTQILRSLRLFPSLAESDRKFSSTAFRLSLIIISHRSIFIKWSSNEKENDRTQQCQMNYWIMKFRCCCRYCFHKSIKSSSIGFHLRYEFRKHLICARLFRINEW